MALLHEGSQQRLAQATCFVKNKIGASIDPADCPEASSSVAGPSHYVPVWMAEDLPGQLDKREVHVDDAHKAKFNITSVTAAVRTAVVDTHPWWGSQWRMIRIVASIYDRPFCTDRHICMSSILWAGDSQYGLRVSVPANVTDPNNKEVVWGQADFRDGRDIQFHILAAPFNISEPMPKGGGFGKAVVPLKFEITRNGTAIETFTLNMRQNWIPYSRMSICMKPLYGQDVPKMLVECKAVSSLRDWQRLIASHNAGREHHRTLGWPLVHWQHRHAGLGKVVDKLNQLTGGFDTFDHTPRMESHEDREDVWDEMATFNLCWVRYKQASEFIGVWDLDEYVAPTPDKPWTGEWVSDYLATNWSLHDPKAGSLQLPMTWLDKARFGPIEDERLLDVDPTLSAADLNDISNMHLSTDGYQARHDEVYVKSIHRTSKVRGANIHHGWGSGEPTWQKPAKLIVYHARDEQFFPNSWYEPWPINESVVSHWKQLARRIRRLRLKRLYDLDVTKETDTA